MDIANREAFGLQKGGNYFSNNEELTSGENVLVTVADPNQNQGQEPGSEPGPGGMGQDFDQKLVFDFTINGQSFTNVDVGETLIVSDNMNFDELEEYYVSKVQVVDRHTNEVIETHNYNGTEYGIGKMYDTENRDIIEAHLNKQSTNYAYLRVEAHVDGIQPQDIPQGQDDSYFYGYYIPQVRLQKSGYKGVEVRTNNMPDMYDFTGFNGIELGDTTLNNPGEVSVYYGEDTINFTELNGQQISEITLLSGKGVPASAVTIDNTNNTVKVNSNYYNSIPLKIKLADGTVGYVTVERIGIFITGLNKGSTVFYHGAFNGNVNNNGGNLNVDTDKDRIVAAFYHGSDKTYNDYDLIANITYQDGTTEVKTAKAVGDVADEGSNLVGSDYILWEGEGFGDAPVKISVTAVKKGAISSKTAFGGATFGAGAGVEWERD